MSSMLLFFFREYLGDKPVSIKLQGVEYMNDDPTSVTVLYAKVIEVDGTQRYMYENS